MSNVSIDLQGAIGSRPAVCNGATGSGNSGPQFQLSLRAANRSAAADQGQTLTTIDDTVNYVALPWPTGLHATVFYLRTADFPAGWTLRLTYETTGQVVLPIHGTVLLETQVDDRITAAEIKGSGQFGWFAAGAIE